MMRLATIWGVAFALALTTVAQTRERPVHRRPIEPARALVFEFDFTNGSGLEWEPGFSDHLPDVDHQTVGEIRLLPPEAGAGTAWFLRGANYSDDLFMFLRRRLGLEAGIVPSQNYMVSFEIELATNAGPECGGIGGSPGESVWVKAGASPVPPTPVVIEKQVHVGINIDKGNQAHGGTHASVAGTITADRSLPCSGDAPFDRITLLHDHPHAIRSSSAATLWPIVGTDSGFEGTTAVYIPRIRLELTPVSDDDPRARWQRTYAAISSLITELRNSGVEIDESSRQAFQPFEAREIAFVVEGEVRSELFMYVFDTHEDAIAASSLVSKDGTTIGETVFEWLGPPHFYLGDHFIVNYAGESELVLSLLEQRLGPPFAGGMP